MNTVALIWMILVQVAVTGTCLSLMIRVLRPGKKREKTRRRRSAA